MQQGVRRIVDARVPAVLLPEGGWAVEDGLVRVDIDIDGGRIGAVRARTRRAPAGDAIDQGHLDQDGGQVWPGFLDCHTHLDKGHIWPRAANPDGAFWSALETVRADREANWSEADVRARFDFGLRSAYAHGTVAIRTHLDSMPGQHAISWPLFKAIRAEWAGRIDLQAVSLIGLEAFATRFGEELADLVAESGGVLGGFGVMTPDLDRNLDRVFALAAERGLDLDFHVDETGDPTSHVLRRVAEATLRHRFEGTVLCGHCCALAVQPDDEARLTLDRVAAAAIAVVSLPMCNLYLQDRTDDRTPRWRGIAPLKEIAARGIPLALASDNCRDPFYAYGDLDGLEVFREGVRIGQLDVPVGDAPALVTRTPARIMGLEGRGRIAPGALADLVLFRARFWSELLSRPQSDRTVLRAGHRLEARPPDYRELDGLFRMDLKG